ncbi:MAG: AsmA family protein [Desulfobacula sp.]|nr:AsmA family protein [Desulfobacula sp.]
MKGIMKWTGIIGGVFLVLIIAAALIIPRVMDIKKYKPVIQEKIASATGRTFTFGDDMDVSVFPWVGVRLTDLRLGNPDGFKEKDMVAVKGFEVRLKVMPLLSKRIEVKTFVLDSPEIYLEKMKDGRANWEGLGKGEEKKEDPGKKTGPSPLGLEALNIDSFSVINGRVTYSDAGAGLKKEISDLNLKLSGISFEKPVGISFSVKLDGKPVLLEGSVGPVGKYPGKGTVPLDLVLKAMDQLEVNIKGSLTDPVATQGFDLDIQVAPFSPKKLAQALNQALPLESKDPGVLEKLALTVKAKGNPTSVSLSSGELVLDDSKLTFSADAKEFSLPNVKFDVQLDHIDLDRYLPEAKAKKETPSSSAPASAGSKAKKTDYGPLRKLILDGKMTIAKLKARGATVEKLMVHVLAKNGVITVDPLTLDLYQGSILSKVEVNVQKDDPTTQMNVDAKGIQAGPLIKDTVKKEWIEGTLKAGFGLSMTGDTPETVKKTLTGQGEFVFTDGAVIGVDLADTVRSLQSILGAGEAVTEKPKTDFAEFKIPFTAKDGLIRIDGTSLSSPLMRVTAGGTAHLATEALDLKIDPKLVATLKGQGDTQARSGLTVPVLITGSFSSPKVRPDIKGMLGTGTGLDPETLKKQVLGGGNDPEQKPPQPDVKQQIKDLLPGFGK